MWRDEFMGEMWVRMREGKEEGELKCGGGGDKMG